MKTNANGLYVYSAAHTFGKWVDIAKASVCVCVAMGRSVESVSRLAQKQLAPRITFHISRTDGEKSPVQMFVRESEQKRICNDTK